MKAILLLELYLDLTLHFGRVQDIAERLNMLPVDIFIYQIYIKYIYFYEISSILKFCEPVATRAGHLVARERR